MIGRLRCWYSGHDPRLIAWQAGNRVESWGCSRCPWATSLTRGLGDPLTPPEAAANHREVLEFAGGILLCLAVVAAIALAGGGSRP